ncbi:MAG: ABC-type transport system involved in cytochrome c biosis, permease component [Acidobacteria bacterium]|jgi:cytochrome c-type biogenesis protein CcsB|nr:ABC-type transport system involved in cytochrome c biosis, permease component [Acidobacteriota bacterium]
MEEVSRIQNEITLTREAGKKSDLATWTSYLPAILAIAGAFLLLGLRLQIGAGFISDAALMMIALACYIFAGLFQLTNLYAPSAMAQKIGLWTATLGVLFNLASWLVRWVAAYDREIAMLRQGGNMETPWVFRYIPFANLYDLSLSFAFGAGIATLLFVHRKNFQVLSAFTLPLAALILTLARFIGAEFIDLPPVLDSYWRPIHVGVASLSYGVALVCFAVAVIYLLKDKVKVEAMAIWSSVFALSVIATISKFSVFTEFVYRAGTFIPNPGGKPFSGFFRLEIPNAGLVLAFAGFLLLGVIVSFLIYLYQNNEAAKKAGHLLLKLSLVVQILAVSLLVSGIKSTDNILPKLQAQLAAEPSQYVTVGRAIAERQNLSAQEFAALTTTELELTAKQFLQTNGDKIYMSLNTNPVEVAGLITAITGTLFVILFGFRTEKIRERLPSLDSLDSLMYKTACLAFAGLAMLLITGAIWANESWGRPWGFDSKETGALVAWLTYAAFLHTRISRGWHGRSSAYFAIIGFLLVIFTYLGVSYLLPGLHSYA